MEPRRPPERPPPPVRRPNHEESLLLPLPPSARLSVPVRVAGGGLPRAEVGLAAAPRLGLRGVPPY